MPPPLSRPDACIFDLDGTLIDSLQDIAESLNECLELLGLPTHPVESYRYLVGEGVPALCQKAIGESHPHMVQRLIELARPRYRVRPLAITRPYPGIAKLIGHLRAKALPIAVLSNKPHDMTVRMVNSFWPERPFARVQGYVEEELRKPNPHYCLDICKGLGVAPAHAWIIGDTPTDVETAARAGSPSIGVTWGFRTRRDLEDAGASWIVDSPAEIAAAIGR